MSTFFEDKRYCIIGGSGALGSEIARELLARGATVHLVVRTPGNVPSDLSVSGISQGDIRNRESLRHALSSFGSTFNGLINAAGLVAFGSLTDVPQEIVSELYAVNAQGTVNVLSLAPEFLEEGGVIASLTGVAADMELLNMSAYCSSKSAAKSAMKVAGREFRSKKLSVLDIRAPHTETGLVNRALFGEAPKMPLGLSPQTVAQRIVKAIEEGEKDLPAESFS